MSNNTVRRKVRFEGDFNEGETVIYGGERGKVVGFEESKIGPLLIRMVPITLDGETSTRWARPDELKRPIVR